MSRILKKFILEPGKSVHGQASLRALKAYAETVNELDPDGEDTKTNETYTKALKLIDKNEEK